MSFGSCAIKELPAKQIIRMKDRVLFILHKLINKETGAGYRGYSAGSGYRFCKMVCTPEFILQFRLLKQNNNTTKG